MSPLFDRVQELASWIKELDQPEQVTLLIAAGAGLALVVRGLYRLRQDRKDRVPKAASLLGASRAPVQVRKIVAKGSAQQTVEIHSEGVPESLLSAALASLQKALDISQAREEELASLREAHRQALERLASGRNLPRAKVTDRIRALEMAAGGDRRLAIDLLSSEGEAAAEDGAELLVEAASIQLLDDPSAARRLLEQATAADPENGRAWGYLGLVQMLLGNLELAHDAYQKDYELRDNEALAAGNLGNIYQMQGDLDRAEELQLRALELFEAEGEDLGVACSYGNLASIHGQRGNAVKAEEMYKRALEVAHRAFGSAADHQERGELDDAARAFQLSLKIYEALQQPAGAAGALGNLAMLRLETEELESADASVWEAIRYADSTGLDELMQMARSQLLRVGYAWANRGDQEIGTPQAEEAYRKALKVFDYLGEAALGAWALLSLGREQESSGELAQAVDSLWRAFELMPEDAPPDLLEHLKVALERVGRAWGVRGYECQVRGEMGGAEDAYLKAAKTLQLLEQPEPESGVQVQLGVVYFQKVDYDRARECWERALKLSRSPKHVQEVNSLLAQLPDRRNPQANSKRETDA